jgi:AraC-like DNA-binding protein
MDIAMPAAARNGSVAFAERQPIPPLGGDLLVCCERQRHMLGSVLLDRVQGVGSVVEHDTGLCRLLFQLSGRSRLDFGGRPAELSAGHWALVTGRGIRLEVERGGEILLLSFAVERLSRSVASRSRSRSFEPLPIRGASRMCLELARSSLAQPEPLNASVADAMADAEIELAKLAIIEQVFTRGDETVRETVRARIQSYIQRNLTDPDLTIERIAERMRCTKRYLHKVFNSPQETLNQYIWSRRLELCRTRLLQPELAGQSITEIAFDCGFSNAAHFSRSFRARFGECPRVYRRLMLAG